MQKETTPKDTCQYPIKDYVKKQINLNDISSNLLETEYKERRLYEYKVVY